MNATRDPSPADRGYPAVYSVTPPYLPTAIVSICVSGVGLLLALVPIVGAVLGLAGAVLGHVSIASLNRNPRPRSGKGLAIAGLVIGYAALAIGVGFVFLVRSVVNGFSS